MSLPGGCWGSRPWATSLLPTWPTSARAPPLTARKYPLLWIRGGWRLGQGSAGSGSDALTAAGSATASPPALAISWG